MSQTEDTVHETRTHCSGLQNTLSIQAASVRARCERTVVERCQLTPGNDREDDSTMYHRLRWNRGGKSDVVAHRLFLAGSTFLGAGVVTAVFLVNDFVFGTVAAAVSAGIVAATVITWYALPAGRSRKAALARSGVISRPIASSRSNKTSRASLSCRARSYRASTARWSWALFIFDRPGTFFARASL
jgi:hypothetical protein